MADDVTFVLRLSIGAILAFAGLAKLRSLDAFRRGLVSYEILPAEAARRMAPALIGIELGVGVLLMGNVFVGSAAIAACALFAIFAAAIGLNLARQRHIACHCFGEDESEKVSWATLVRALALVGASAFLAMRGSIGAFPSAEALAPDLTLVGGAVVIARTFALLPLAWRFLRREVPSGPVPSARMSFHGEGLDASLRPFQHQFVAGPTLSTNHE